MFWGGQDSNMVPSCDLPLPPDWKPALSTWSELEPQANFVSDPMDQHEPHIPAPTIERLKEELRMRKLLRLPTSSLKKIFGHNAVLDSGATSSFIKPDGGAIPTGQSSFKPVRMPNGQTLKTPHSRRYFPINCSIQKPENATFYQDFNTAHWSVLAN